MKTILLILMVIANAASAQDIDSWTPQSLKARFGELTHVKSVGGKIRTITFGPLTISTVPMSGFTPGDHPQDWLRPRGLKIRIWR